MTPSFESIWCSFDAAIDSSTVWNRLEYTFVDDVEDTLEPQWFNNVLIKDEDGTAEPTSARDRDTSAEPKAAEDGPPRKRRRAFFQGRSSSYMEVCLCLPALFT